MEHGQHSASFDTSDFEVRASFGQDGRLTEECAIAVRRLFDEHGFVVVTDVVPDSETSEALQFVKRIIEDPSRIQGSFASETDTAYRRRDFCPLPLTHYVLSVSASICKRLSPVLDGYCERTRPLLEVSTLTSYRGCSHQYIHRDPTGAICMFVAVTDVSPSQGGTVFIPGTHACDARRAAREQSPRWETAFQTLCNSRIFRRNRRMLQRMKESGDPPLAPGEWRARVFSWQQDSHQPNLLRFLFGRHQQFSLARFRLPTVWRLLWSRKQLQSRFRVVQTAPRRGTIILYHSDILHAGPDNQSKDPRYFFVLSLASQDMTEDDLRTGYSPHPTLVANPVSYGDLLDLASEQPRPAA